MSRLFPKQADNAYNGQTAGLWLFGAVVVLRLVVGLGSMFNGRGAAVGADGIPLDSYGAAGAQTVLALFGLLGLARVVTSIVYLTVLVRYRALVPLMFTLILLEQAGRRAVLYFLPIVRTGSAGGATFNDALLIAIVVGVALSLWPRRSRATPAG